MFHNHLKVLMKYVFGQFIFKLVINFPFDSGRLSLGVINHLCVQGTLDGNSSESGQNGLRRYRLDGAAGSQMCG